MIRFTLSSQAIRRISESQKGSILVGALAILLVLSTIFVAALTFALTRYGHHVKSRNEVTAQFLAEAGIERCISQLTRQNMFVSIPKAPTPNGGFITVRSIAWGPYLLIISKGQFTNQEVALAAQVGSAPPSIFEAAVTVSDQKAPFVVAGAATIVGDVNTGKLGMTPGQLRGEKPPAGDFFQGRLQLDDKLSLPSIDSTVLNSYMVELAERRRSATKIIYGSLVCKSGDELTFDSNHILRVENGMELRDFRFVATDDIHSIFVNGSVEIRGNSKIGGLLEIVSNRSIVVMDSCYLDNVLLVARDSIVFEDDVHFSGMTVSQNSIRVKDHAQLYYPSVLVVDDNSKKKLERPNMNITSRSGLESICVVRSADSVTGSPNANIYLDTLSQLTGLLFTNGKSDIRGILNGSVVTGSFQYFEQPTTYVNWVYNCMINRTALDYVPVPPILVSQDTARFAILRMDRL